MKKIKTIFIQVRTCDEEEWLTLGAKCTRYTDFTEAIRDYNFEDFYYAIRNEKVYNWEHTYFKARINWLTGIKRVVCLTKNVEMTERSCSKIFIREIAIEQNVSDISFKTLTEVLPTKDFIEWMKDQLKQEINIIQN